MKSKKSDYIRFLVDSETKLKFKELAKGRNTNMSDMLNEYIEKELEKSDYNKNFNEEIKEKSIITDEKLLALRGKMEERSQENQKEKKKLFDWFK